VTASTIILRAPQTTTTHPPTDRRALPGEQLLNTTFVFIPKCRRKTLYLQLRRYRGEVFRKLAEQTEGRIEEGHLMSDHVHIMISIPPKYAGFAGHWVHQGQERDPPGAGVWGKPAELRWSEFSGARVFRIDGRTGRRGDTELHSQSRAQDRAREGLCRIHERAC
jgi:REP element-mobilizing transposase RayT